MLVLHPELQPLLNVVRAALAMAGYEGGITEFTTKAQTRLTPEVSVAGTYEMKSGVSFEFDAVCRLAKESEVVEISYCDLYVEGDKSYFEIRRTPTRHR